MPLKYKPWQRCLFCVVLLCAVALIMCVCVALLGDKPCSPDTFKHAAVAADSKLCSEIGRDMLRQGGSAVDGAIAALLCTSLLNPQSMGLGGGSIFTIKDKTGEVKVFNSRETVPQSFKANLLKDCPASALQLTTGSQWIGVPGELRGYEEVHKRYGKLRWSQLFEPTIKLAREGFPLPLFLARLLQHRLIGPVVKNSSLCELFCNKNKTVMNEGDTLKFPKLAETMERIAEQGADAFYTGKIGLDLIQDIKEAGGSMTMEDLRSYRVRIEEAWTIPLENGLMHIPPPPAGGALLAFILKLMEGFHLSPKSLIGDEKIQTYQRYIEAAKFANGQRESICDPIFNPGKNATHLIDPDFADHIRAMITTDRTHSDSYYNIQPSSDRTGTTHVSVLAEDGSAVSVTSTINQIFGAAIYSPRTGIILNNELVDFCGRADIIRAGEQPPSSMAPVIFDSRTGETLVIGGSGGSMITTAMALSMMNHLWLGMDLKDAIADKIVYVDAKNNVKFEGGFDKAVIKGLRALGHKVVEDSPYFFNVVNAVARKGGCIKAISDSRKYGQAAGY